MSCSVDRRCGSVPELLWLWCRLVAAALIQHLNWELPCATCGLKKTKEKKKKKKEKKRREGGKKEGRKDEITSLLGLAAS